MEPSPFEPFLSNTGFVVLDGGLATELEAQGADLKDHLWSARLLNDNPSLIRETHLAYYRAGADVAISASYQASFEGFLREGFDRNKATELLLLSVKLAVEARDQFWQECKQQQQQQQQQQGSLRERHRQIRTSKHDTRSETPTPNATIQPCVTASSEESREHAQTRSNEATTAAAAAAAAPQFPQKHCSQRDTTHRLESTADGVNERRRRRLRPLVAASLGCYGAALADGSEYRGDYGDSIGQDGLKEWHKERVDVLATADGVDLLVFETIPCLAEVRAILSLLQDSSPSIGAVISVSCKDEQHLRSGELVRDFAELIWGKKLGGETSGGGSGGPEEPRTAVPACVVGVGANCTAPTYIAGVLRILSDTAKSRPRNGDTTATSSNREGEDTTLGKKCLSVDSGNPSSPALVAYPNSGEDWDATGKDWVKGTGFRGGGGVGELGRMAREWFADTEACVFGGCCRTRPAHITEIREALLLESGGAFLETTS